MIAASLSVAGGECLYLGSSGFISLEHLISCDPFYINHFPQGCPHSKTLCPIAYQVICVSLFMLNVIYYSLLMKLSLLLSLCSLSTFSHNYENIRISTHSLKEIE